MKEREREVRKVPLTRIDCVSSLDAVTVGLDHLQDEGVFVVDFGII